MLARAGSVVTADGRTDLARLSTLRPPDTADSNSGLVLPFLSGREDSVNLVWVIRTVGIQ